MTRPRLRPSLAACLLAVLLLVLSPAALNREGRGGAVGHEAVVANAFGPSLESALAGPRHHRHERQVRLLPGPLLLLPAVIALLVLSATRRPGPGPVLHLHAPAYPAPVTSRAPPAALLP